MAYLQVESVNHLIELCGDDRVEFFVHLGVARSSKSIMYDSSHEEFDIYHEIDDTWEEVSKKDLEKTFIGEAIEKGAFYKY